MTPLAETGFIISRGSSRMQFSPPILAGRAPARGGPWLSIAPRSGSRPDPTASLSELGVRMQGVEVLAATGVEEAVEGHRPGLGIAVDL
jgi:hypothetical protein